jgi:hypothetical protein
MAHPPGRRKTPPPAPDPEPENEHRHLIQTRINDGCRDEINERSRAAGLRPGPWLRMFLYEQLGVTPKKE